ncbi:MAG: hypothetical protein MUO99_06295 [Dehalococcoidales bacterium]|nr:hypothetical protein [Dehalococcoidales bacterium]
MKRAILGRTTNDLRQELVLLKEGARIAAAKFEELRRQAESFKIKALRRHLEDRRRHVARSRGFTLVSRNGKRLGTSLGIAAAGSIIAGMVTKDKRAAANAGLSTFYSVLKEAGKTDCAV